MVYIQGVAEQTQIFLFSIGFGFLLGILYDVFRTVRMIISESKGFVLFMDLLYFLVCTFLNFCYILTVDYGKIRFYVVFAQILGWLIYYFSFGAVAIRFSRFISKAVRGIAGLVFKPINAVFKRIRLLYNKIFGFNKKIIRKFAKKTKFNLQKRQGIVYNLIGYFDKCSHNKKQRD